jgi:hypothetical protein
VWRELLGAGACVAVGAACAARDPVGVVSTTHREPSHAPADTPGGTEARAKRLTPRRNIHAVFSTARCSGQATADISRYNTAEIPPRSAGQSVQSPSQ